MDSHILPFADVVAWCLMPNHFHLMLVPRDSRRTTNTKLTDSRPPTNTTQLTDSRPPTNTLNQSIGILLASYTRAIQKQENITGSLFRQKTKAKCITGIDGITPSYFNTTFGTMINSSTTEKEYPKVCFDYIHDNPVKAGLVECSEDWEFSSIQEYYGKQKYGLINFEIAKEFGLV